MITEKQAKRLSKKYNIDHDIVPFDIWHKALNIELEHKGLTKGNLTKTASIVMDHLDEDVKYYQKLIKMEGGAITDIIKDPIGTVKKAFSDLDDFNNISKETLEKYGNIPVSFCVICRTPLQKLLLHGINALSLGMWNKLQAKYGYDELYHLFLVVNLRNGQKIIMEKNEVVNISPFDPSRITSTTQTQKVPIVKLTNPNIMLDNTLKQMGTYNMFHYDAFTNNCQIFIKNILSSNGMLTPAGEKFIMQAYVPNIQEDLKKANRGYVPKAMKKITDIGRIGSVLIGKGNEEKAKKDFLKYLKKNNLSIQDMKALNKEFLHYINTEGLKFL
jgi:hypothetical protein